MADFLIHLDFDSVMILIELFWSSKSKSKALTAPSSNVYEYLKSSINDFW